jgi:hypothetical protein
MNAAGILAIPILTAEVANTCRGPEGQVHIVLDMRCGCPSPSMTIMTLVHSMHQPSMGVENRPFNWRQLHPLHVQNIIIKTPECVPSTLRCPEFL